MSNMISKGLGSPAPLTVSSTSVALTAIPGDAKRAVLRVTAADIHIENDATAADTNSFLVRAEEIINLSDHRYNLLDFRLIRAASTDATVYITYYN